MKVFNLSNNTQISSNLKKADSLSDKLLGMIKKSNSRGLILKTRFGIHTFFLKKPIDVIVLDKNFRVVKLAIIQPNKFFFWNIRYDYVLELPEGSIKKTQTKADDMLHIAQ